MLILLFLLLFAVPVQAASIIWDDMADGFLLLEYSANEGGPFTVIKEIPAYPPRYPITEFGYYKLTAPNGGPSSNVARYFSDIDTGWQDVVAALDTRVKALESPVSVTNITAKQIDANRIEITGLACTKLATTGSGLKRIVECIH
jgi:hypothetical protein